MADLLVADGGGHLTELVTLAPRVEPAIHDPLWVTGRSAQADSLLGDDGYVPSFAPTTRDLPNALRNLRLARRLLRTHDVDRVISTGAGVAVPFLVAAAGRHEAIYVESAARIDRPSLSGRLLTLDPRVELLGQHPGLTGRRWRFVGSVFDGFDVERSPGGRDHLRVFVSAGTHGFPFPRLVRIVTAALGDDDDVEWQLGSTAVEPSRGRATDVLGYDEQLRAIRLADVVVGHGGVGLALTALLAGKLPVLVPRRADLDEHVDDHQVATSSMLAARGLALTPTDGVLTRAALVEAARATVRAGDPPSMRLGRRR